MLFTSADTITRRILLRKRWPLHYYLQVLGYVAESIRELSIDSLQIVNTVELIPGPTMAIDLPCDMVDWVFVGTTNGQFVRPIVQRNEINNLTKLNTTGQPVLYGDTLNDGSTFDWPFGWGWAWGSYYYNMDDLGEPTGRLYGLDTTQLDPNGFKYLPERNQIQLTEDFRGCKLYLVYIGNGQSADNITQVDVMAQDCIERYADWKLSPGADIDRSPQGTTYYNAKRRFRSRKNQLTPVDIRRILFSAYGNPYKH